MGSMFAVFNETNSALNTYRTWLSALGDNVANVNTVKPTSEGAFQERLVEVREKEGGGVEVAAIHYGSDEGVISYDPNSPLADEKGEVRAPGLDMSEQMASMIAAQRGYQLNLAVLDRARAAYEAALQIGK